MDLIYSPQNNKTMLQIESKDNTNAIEQEIQKFKEDYGALQISGVLDRDGYKSVQEAAKTVRARRLELQKEAKAIDQKIAQIKKDFNANAALIIGGLDQLEMELRQKLQTIDDEKERIKQAEKGARLEKFVTRTQQLFDIGFLFNGSVYTLGAIMVTTDSIHELEEEAFAEIVEQGKVMKAEIDAREAERQKMLQELEQSRIKSIPQYNTSKIILDEAGEFVPEEEADFWAGKPVDLPFDTDLAPSVAFAPKMEFKPELNHLPVGYTLGFDAARNKVLQILESTEKMTRDELKTRIRELEY
jgi:hypothetical protein